MSTNTETSKVTNINGAANQNTVATFNGAAEDLERIAAATEMAGERKQGARMIGAVIVPRAVVRLQESDGSSREAEVAVVASAVNTSTGPITAVRMVEAGQSEARQDGVPGEVALFSLYRQGEDIRGGASSIGGRGAITNVNEALAQALGTEVAPANVPITPEQVAAIAKGVEDSQAVAFSNPGAEQISVVPLEKMIPELHRVA